jgi:hypothetical protein
LRANVDIQSWLSTLPPALANVRMEITLPFDAIFPDRKG